MQWSSRPKVSVRFRWPAPIAISANLLFRRNSCAAWLLASRGSDVRLDLLGRQTVTLREDLAQIDLGMPSVSFTAIRFMLRP